jgi:predicted dehydrogenase
MAPLRVGVIGASRRHNGTGEFVARFLSEAGAAVVAVAGTSLTTASEAAERLRASSGAAPVAAASPAEMIARCSLDAVAICSPSHGHAEQLTLALEAGLHVFCEKPLIWDDSVPSLPQATQLLEQFAARGRVVHLNTQWIYTLPSFKQLHPLADHPHSFEMTMSPPLRGPAMLPEALPHPISLLVALGATGRVSGVRGQWSPERDKLELRFTAATTDGHDIEATCAFREMKSQPRDASYAIDGRRVVREVDLSTYAIRLRANGRSIALTDPVKLSVRRFLDRVDNNDYHGQTAHLRANVRMLDEIVAALGGMTEGGDGGGNP